MAKIENMTLGAIRAIEESDVIVGYKKYVAQISDLVSDKEIIKKGMGDEIDRAQLAIDKSLAGQTVSLISSEILVSLNGKCFVPNN